jgi:hypothetical protein
MTHQTLHLLVFFIMILPKNFTSAWTVEWVNVGTKIGNIIPPRSGHVAFELHGKVFVFGGYAEESPENRYPTNDLWAYDPAKEDSSWSKVDCSSPPQQRLAAAAVTCRLDGQTTAGIVLGGWDSQEAGTGGVILQDLQVFTENGEENAWKELGMDLEQPTSRLCAVTLDGPSSPSQVLIHNHRCIDHVVILDLESSKLIKQPTTGTPPSARGLHVIALLRNRNKLVLFGGAAQDGTMSNEVFILDTLTWTWDKVQIEGDAPSPRASPCLVALDETTCLLYGGASRTEDGGLHGCSDTWLLELISNDPAGESTEAKWTLLYQDGSPESPPGRNAASLTPISKPYILKDDYDDKEMQYFLLTGGWYPFRTTYSDNFVLKVSKARASSS